jgi:hypothetical protein
MVCTFEKDFVPVSALVVEDINNCSIYCLKQFKSKNRNYVVAAAKGWIFIIEIKQNVPKEIHRSKSSY